MSEALFAIAGTIVGVLGAVLTTWVSAVFDDRKNQRDMRRSLYADFTSEIVRLRNISIRLRLAPDDKELQQAAEDAHSRARALQEQLRFTSTSKATQEAARWLVHNAYFHWRSTQGGRGDFWEARKQLDSWLTKFYVTARKELGLDPSDLYEDPENGLPVPMADNDERVISEPRPSAGT